LICAFFSHPFFGGEDRKWKISFYSSLIWREICAFVLMLFAVTSQTFKWSDILPVDWGFSPRLQDPTGCHMWTLGRVSLRNWRCFWYSPKEKEEVSVFFMIFCRHGRSVQRNLLCSFWMSFQKFFNKSSSTSPFWTRVTLVESGPPLWSRGMGEGGKGSAEEKGKSFSFVGVPLSFSSFHVCQKLN
jgi:hypothetical protein